MKNDEEYFKPGSGVELVFDIDNPITRSSIILEQDILRPISLPSIHIAF